MDARGVFEILVKDHADMLLAFLRSCVRDAALVDDLFQETFLTAWKILDRFDKSRPFGPWLRGIAAKHVLAARRSRKTKVFLCDAALLEAIETAFQQGRVDREDQFADQVHELRDCLQRLPEHARVALETRYQLSAGLEEVAARLQLPLETLKKRLQRARSQLLKCLHSKRILIEDPA